MTEHGPDTHPAPTSSGATAGANAPAAVSPRASRSLVVETVLLLMVSLGASAIWSLLAILDKLTVGPPLAEQTTSINVSVTPDRPWLDLSYQLARIVIGVMPALLAVYLVAAVRVPREGAGRALGLAPRRPGFDLAWGAILFAGIGIPGIALYLGARALGLNTTVAAGNLSAHWWTVPVYIGLALMNGILEETIMIGYLFTRWLQAGWARWQVLVVSALVRGSYHLYQGFGGFIGNVIMGLIFGVFFLKVRRLWPLIVAHTLLDIASFVGYAWLAGRVSWL